MSGGFGAMLSIRLASAEAALDTAGRMEIFHRATSLGGVESLVEHRATAEGANTVSPPDLLRLSVGLEDVEDLWQDLEQAIGKSR
jgi:cystathionine gamma-synthase